MAIDMDMFEEKLKDAVRTHLSIKKYEEIPFEIDWWLRHNQRDKRVAKLSVDHALRIILCETAYEYKKQKKLRLPFGT